MKTDDTMLCKLSCIGKKLWFINLMYAAYNTLFILFSYLILFGYLITHTEVKYTLNANLENQIIY